MDTIISLPQALVHIGVDDGRIAQCRPQLDIADIAELLDGCQFDEVLVKLRSVCSLSTEAHRWAAVSLLEQDAPVRPETQAARAQAVWLEWISEHSWQLWSSAHHILPHCESRLELLNQWRQQLTSLRNRLASHRYQPYAEIEPVTMPQLSDWRDQWRDLVYEPLLDAIEQQHWADRFITSTVDVQELESGPVHRLHMANVGMNDRFEALWIELWHAADWTLAPAQNAIPLIEPGVVAAARGNVSHRCDWTDGVAGFYDVDFPTGAILESVSRSLNGMTFKDSPEWRQSLSLWLQSYAPCVEISVEYEQALVEH